MDFIFKHTIIAFVAFSFYTNILAINTDSLKEELNSARGFQRIEKLNKQISSIHRDSLKPIETLIRHTIELVQQDEDNELLLAKTYMILGRYLFDREQYNDGLDTIYISKNIYINNDDTIGIGMFYFTLGTYYAKITDFDKSILYFDSAIIIFKKHNLKRDLARAYNSLAINYHKKNDWGKGIRYYKKSEKINLQIKNKRELLRNYSNLALIYKNVWSKESKDTNYSQMVSYNDKLIAIREELNISADQMDIFNLAGSYMKIGEWEKARKITEPVHDALIKEIGWTSNSFKLMLNNDYKDHEAIWTLQIFSIRLSHIYDHLGMTQKALSLAYTAYEAQKVDKIFNNKSMSDLVESSKVKAVMAQRELETQVNLVRQRWVIAIISFLVIFSSIFLFVYRANNRALSKKNKIIEKHRESILDSINYAQKIQESTLPSSKRLNDLFKECLLIYRPRDIVSGDFYWCAKNKNEIFVSVSDCTGHGVPAAFLSLMGSRILGDLISYKKILEPSEILKEMHKEMVKVFSKQELKSKRHWIEGMDIGICKINTDTKTLVYSGALRNLMIERKGQLEIIEGDPISVGGLIKPGLKQKTYTQHEINIEDATCFMGTDGLWDQFGEKTGEKLNIKKFRELLTKKAGGPMSIQKTYIENELIIWQGNQYQTDDMMLLGFRV